MNLKWHLAVFLVYQYVSTGGGAVNLKNGTTYLRNKALEMFDHAYNAYMTHAYPADELMPLSCQGRFRGNRPSRGDVDESLGNFTLTLVDTLDTLALLGRLDEFETAIRLVLQETSFDTDVVVSVFETNIRMLGGLLGGHVAAVDLKESGKCCQWYTDELLTKALDLGERLLAAFNSNSGIPYPKVNLKTGLKNLKFRDTCTACAGTMVLEFAALSRLTGDNRFEEAAHKAMDFLWDQRNVHSNLMGTVLNVNNGDWVRRESGIGAGIDSYYEYLLKAYILLGDDVYLTRFNKHYDAIMTYINQGPIMLNVDMHKPTSSSRNIMDSLLAFWPGLQVLKGDLRSAIEIHEVLYQITQRHNFLPEAVTTDFHVHWGQHPLRPEFVESTYFLYKATGDPHYLDVGRTVLENLEKHARVPCGFAAIKDVRGNTHEDQMDSYVLAETFKYLYLLFEEEENLVLDVSQYVFTTEAHLLPLSLAKYSSHKNNKVLSPPPRIKSTAFHDHSCPNIKELSSMSTVRYAETIRSPLKNYVELKCPKPKPSRPPRIRAVDFKAEDGTQMRVLTSMGVQVHQTADGRLQLSHVPGKATSSELAEEGLSFMKEMLELAQSQQEAVVDPRIVQIRPSDTTKPKVSLPAGSARFGWDFTLTPNTPNRHKVWEDGYRAPLVIAEPLQACEPLTNQDDISGKVALAQRGSCTFMEKARTCQNAGAVAAIIIDNIPGSNRKSSGVFQMSGDREDDVFIAVVFLYSAEATTLLEAYKQDPQLEVYIARQAPKEPVVSEIKYPQFVVIYETPNLKLNVFEKEFSLSLTLQSRVPADTSLSLQDSVEIEQQGDRHHIDLTAATPAYFNLETGVMPTTGVIFQITLDLLVEFLAECKGIAHQYTFLNHIASIGRYIKFVYMDEEANDGLTEKDYSNMMELIPVIVKCFGQLRGTSSDEQSQGQVDLEVSSEQEMEPEQEISNEQETENINTKTSSGAEEIIVTKPKSIRRDTNYVLATDPQQVKVVDVVEPSDIQSPKSINLDKDEL